MRVGPACVFAVVIVAQGACNQVLGIGDVTASRDAAVASPDASAATLVLAQIPARIAVGDTVDVSFTIQAAPSTTVQWSITSGGGAFTPASGTVATTSGGLGVITTSYSAPSAPGDLAHTLALTAGTTSQQAIETKVRALVAYGQSTAFANNQGQNISPNYLFGQAVTLPADGYVMRLGLVSTSGAYNARMALYTDKSGAPGDLVAGSAALQPISAGVDELHIEPTLAHAGTYWIMVNPDSAAPINESATDDVAQAFITLPTTSALPATISGATVAPARIHNFYVLTAL